MASIAEMAKSRMDSIAKLEAEVATYQERIKKVGATSAAGFALASVVKVHNQRLKKLREELAGFQSLLDEDARQVPIPGTEKSRK